MNSRLTQAWNARQNVHVAIHHRNRHPQVLLGKHKLLRQVARLVRRQLHHAQLGAQLGRVRLPRKGALLRWVRAGEALHLLKGFLVQLEWEAEGLGNGLVGDVVVAAGSVSVMDY